MSHDKNEAYTPLDYILRVKRVMGSIDLDPASCEAAQTIVKATTYYTKEDDGMSIPWSGNVWLNPPYNTNPKISEWVYKFIYEYRLGRMKQGIILLNAGMSSNYVQALIKHCTMFAITTSRIKFLDENLVPMGRPRHDNLFAYFGDSEGAYGFLREFREVGFVARTVI